MGKNISATLAFGVDLGEDAPFGEDKDGEQIELGEYLALQSGAKNPWDDLPPEVNSLPYEQYKEWLADHPDFEKATDEWRSLCNRLENECPVELDWYGTMYGDYSCYVLVLKQGKQEGSWSAPVEVQIPNLGPEGGVTEKRVRKAQEFCDFHGLPSFDDAKWLLYALEG